MVLAFAALLFQFAPAAPALPDVAVVSLTPAANSASPNSTPGQPKSTASGSSSQNAMEGNSPAILNAAAVDATSQDSRALSAIRIREPLPAKPVPMISPETPQRRSWFLLSIAQHSAATFDAYSTRQAVSTGATEADPFMRPFAHSPGIYAAIQIGPAVLDYAARRMQRSENGFIRRNWWIPQTASTGLFLFSGVHNMGVANRH